MAVTKIYQMVDVVGGAFVVGYTRDPCISCQCYATGTLRITFDVVRSEYGSRGGGDEWSTALAQTPICHPDILMMDWGMFPAAPNTALDDLHKACPTALVIILISTLMDCQQAALLAGADVFISKSDLPERVAEHLRTAAAKISASSSLC